MSSSLTLWSPSLPTWLKPAHIEQSTSWTQECHHRCTDTKWMQNDVPWTEKTNEATRIWDSHQFFDCCGSDLPNESQQAVKRPTRTPRTPPNPVHLLPLTDLRLVLINQEEDRACQRENLPKWTKRSLHCGLQISIKSQWNSSFQKKNGWMAPHFKHTLFLAKHKPQKTKLSIKKHQPLKKKKCQPFLKKHPFCVDKLHVSLTNATLPFFLEKIPLLFWRNTPLFLWKTFFWETSLFCTQKTLPSFRPPFGFWPPFVDHSLLRHPFFVDPFWNPFMTLFQSQWNSSCQKPPSGCHFQHVAVSGNSTGNRTAPEMNDRKSNTSSPASRSTNSCWRGCVTFSVKATRLPRMCFEIPNVCLDTSSEEKTWNFPTVQDRISSS